MTGPLAITGHAPDQAVLRHWASLRADLGILAGVLAAASAGPVMAVAEAVA